MIRNWLYFVVFVWFGLTEVHSVAQPYIPPENKAIAQPKAQYEGHEVVLGRGESFTPPSELQENGFSTWIRNDIQYSRYRNASWSIAKGFTDIPALTGSVLNEVSEDGRTYVFNLGSFRSWKIGPLSELHSLSQRLARSEPKKILLANGGMGVFAYSGVEAKTITLWNYQSPQMYAHLDDPDDLEMDLVAVSPSTQFIAVNRRRYSSCTTPGICPFSFEGAVWYLRYNPQQRVARWELFPIPLPGAWVVDVNNRGEVAGNSSRGVFRYNVVTGKVTILGSGEAWAIHPYESTVVGRGNIRAVNGVVESDAVRWNANGVMTDLATLTKISGGLSKLQIAMRINRRGDILAGNPEGSNYRYWYLDLM